MREISFAIIGCGAAARHHVHAFEQTEGGKLCGVYGAIDEQARAFAEEFDIKQYKTIDELWNDKSIDVVTICTPSGSHAALAIEAMEHGKHVVVEKPVALKLADCDKVIETSERCGKECAVISQLQFSDNARAVKAAIDAGYLGKIVNVGVYMKFHRSEEYYASSDWRGTWEHDGGGALMNQGIHGIDLMRYFMGSPIAISAVTKTLRHNIEAEDTAAAILEYPNGAIGVIEGTTSVFPGYNRRFELCGTKGSIVLEEDHIVKWDIEAPEPESMLREKRSYGASNPDEISVCGHALQFDDMIEAINTGRHVTNNVSHGAATVAIILGIYESARTKKRIEFINKF